MSRWTDFTSPWTNGNNRDRFQIMAGGGGYILGKQQYDQMNEKLPTAPQAPTPPPGPPTIDEARRRANQQDVMRRRRGRAATILTEGMSFNPTTASATLLGD